MLGRRDDIALRRVGDDNAALGGRFQVDVVDPDPRPPDYLEVVGLGDQVGVDLRGTADYQRIVFTYLCFQLGAIPIDPEIDVEILLEQLDSGSGYLLFD